MCTGTSPRRLLLVATLAAGLSLAAAAIPASAGQNPHRHGASRLASAAACWTDQGSHPWAFAQHFLHAIFAPEGAVMDPLGGH